MHKSFYASGFLYHLETQQILLHQSRQKNDTSSLWSMLGGASHKEEIAEKAFQRIMYKLVKVKLVLHDIRPVYDYFHSTRKKKYYVFYAQVTEMKNFRSFRRGTLSWFTFKQTLKLPFTEGTKQDIIVSERVIRAQARDDEEKMISTLENISL